MKVALPRKESEVLERAALVSQSPSIQPWVPENVLENNFKNCSSETENNKELQAECEDPPFAKNT